MGVQSGPLPYPGRPKRQRSHTEIESRMITVELRNQVDRIGILAMINKNANQYARTSA